MGEHRKKSGMKGNAVDIRSKIKQKREKERKEREEREFVKEK